MDSYDIYFRGELTEEAELTTTRAALASLFKANDATMDKLFSGKLQVIKRGCDKATALKYQNAMRKVGARAVITAAEPSEKRSKAASPATASQKKIVTSAKKAPNAAERIAALAARPDIAFVKPGSNDDAEALDDTSYKTPAFTLAPKGSPLFDKEQYPQSSAPEPAARVSTSEYAVAEVGAQMSTALKPEAPPAPDTDHMSMGAVGDTIPTLPRFEESEILSPDTSAIDLCPPDTGFDDLVKPVEDADIDLSDYSVAGAGADLGQAPRPTPPPPPNTSHINLES